VTRPLPTRTGPVRYRLDTFELRCDDCAQHHEGPRFWPLTTEFWLPGRGMVRCRACWYELDKRKARERRAADPELQRALDRARYRRDRHQILLKRQAYYGEHKAQIKARRAATQQRQRGEEAA
jgi:hypothetical protein